MSEEGQGLCSELLGLEGGGGGGGGGNDSVMNC